MMALCSGFRAKRPTGPLRQWCQHCSRHTDDHTAPSPSHTPISPLLEPTSTVPPHPDPQPNLPRASRVRCVVWDFDMTLSCKQVGMMDVSSASVVAERCFGGNSRVQMIHGLWSELTGAGVLHYVVTRNSEYIVKKALAAVGLEVEGVVGDEKFGMDVPKSGVMEQVVLRPNGWESSEILFVDDDAANIRDVSQNLVGCTCVWVNNTGRKLRGIDPQDCEQILSIALTDVFNVCD
eukprot:TRINITY_DN11875_c0_g16_i1.p1 TRINITY_DN11875_c0_g16~~TRINITY_DN11875_c0_g16_i1.p1  ORF type:complete len:235 (-),score=44.45 TRINITY_DN11875_c0_g16_i1:201-905(-)